MKPFVLLGLVVLAIVVILKHLRHGAGLELSAEVQLAPAGVPHYSPIIAAQNIAQVRAGWITNPDAVSTPGYAPAFGADENQVGDGEMAY